MTVRAPRRNFGPRRDALPEHYDYRDTGCEIAPSCLRCPLPVCKYELPKRELRGQLARMARVAELRDAGMTVMAIAVQVGASKRTVQRDLRVLAGRPRWGGGE